MAYNRCLDNLTEKLEDDKKISKYFEKVQPTEDASVQFNSTRDSLFRLKLSNNSTMDKYYCILI